jgi:hypothetical protein
VQCLSVPILEFHHSPSADTPLVGANVAVCSSVLRGGRRTRRGAGGRASNGAERR